MPRWLVHNWELKLLAISVAAIVWCFVVSADRSRSGFAAPVEYVGLEGSRVALGTPREPVDVQLEAARWAAARLTPVDPEIVEVKGPRTTIEERTTVETAPVDVSGVRQSVTRSVGLLLPDSVHATTQRTVQVTVEIRPEDSMRTRGPGGAR